ncbi:hypothetical protein HYS28_01825 [Candidatus Uhrbacteria bacterium]|nr:hypothetical protein [Candidatus Uhrbacteria bacterium]
MPGPELLAWDPEALTRGDEVRLTDADDEEEVFFFVTKVTEHDREYYFFVDGPEDDEDSLMYIFVLEEVDEGQTLTDNIDAVTIDRLMRWLHAQFDQDARLRTSAAAPRIFPNHVELEDAGSPIVASALCQVEIDMRTYVFFRAVEPFEGASEGGLMLMTFYVLEATKTKAGIIWEPVDEEDRLMANERMAELHGDAPDEAEPSYDDA